MTQKFSFNYICNVVVLSQFSHKPVISIFLQTISFISCCTWFLVVGALNHYKDEESIASPTFWSFMSFVFFVPATSALIFLMIVLYLVNYVSEGVIEVRAKRWPISSF